MADSDNDEYRWIVTVTTYAADRPFAREVTTAGPNPDVAAKRALDAIQADTPGNDMWQADSLSVKVERVR